MLFSMFAIALANSQTHTDASISLGKRSRNSFAIESPLHKDIKRKKSNLQQDNNNVSIAHTKQSYMIINTEFLAKQFSQLRCSCGGELKVITKDVEAIKHGHVVTTSQIHNSCNNCNFQQVIDTGLRPS